MRVGPDPFHADRDRVWRLVQAQPGSESTELAEVLDRLCRAVVTELDLMGAAVALPPQADAHVVVAASNAAARRLEELQFDTGEGPSLEACRTRFPVLLPDLAVDGLGRWPGFTHAACDAGVGSAFVLPLHLGASLLGVLTLYRGNAGGLPSPGMSSALVFADIAVEILIDRSLTSSEDPSSHTSQSGSVATAQPGQRGATGERDSATDATFGEALDRQAVVFQAQGMVMVQLRVTLTEALARMRAFAYAEGLTLAALSAAIINGTTSLVESERES